MKGKQHLQQHFLVYSPGGSMAEEGPNVLKFVPNSFHSTPSQIVKYLLNITSYSWFNIIIEVSW
jgi:hypothetical protein